MYLPTLVLGPVAGALADRTDRRRLLSVLTTAQTLVAAVLAVLALTGRLSVPTVAVLAFLAGCVNALVAPVYSSLLAELVPRGSPLRAEPQLGTVQPRPHHRSVAGRAGDGRRGAGDGVLLQRGELLRGPGVAGARPAAAVARAPGARHLWAEIVTGFRVAREDAGIRTALVLTCLISVLVAPFIALIPVYAITVFGHGAAGTSLLATAQGVGAIAAAVLTGTLADRWGRRRLVSRMTLTLGVVATAYWVVPRFWMAVVLVAMLGGAYLSTLTGVIATCMSRVSRLLQARVSSLYTMVLGVGYAMGLLALSWLGDHLGLRLVMATAAALLTASVAWMRRRGLLALLDGPAQFLGRDEVTFAVPTLAGPATMKEVPGAKNTGAVELRASR